MTPDQFFAKFALFADTPNAVAKMRELILDLAVRGKLVPQNPSDGTAAQLTEKISSQSVWQKRKTDNSTTVVSPLFQIPLCWEWIRLAAISLNIQYGYTASADEKIGRASCRERVS